jgi:carotenoid 1,2-hydratase
MELDEIGAPLPQRIKGRIRLMPTLLNTERFAIDSAGRHGWLPIAPLARVEVELDAPAIRWSGQGYFDSNGGDEPIAKGFSTWDWSRADLGASCVTLYDAVGQDGLRREIAARFSSRGVERLEPPPRRSLPGTVWRIDRQTQAHGEVQVLKTLEDTPFYARSLLDTTLYGERGHAMHETLNVARFDTAWVRMLLPWRMPRRFF